MEMHRVRIPRFKLKHNIKIYTRYKIHTFALCCMCILRSLSKDVALGSREGTAVTPTSSRLSFGILYFSTMLEPYSKHSSAKCSEHTTELTLGSHLSLFRRMKSSHFFRLLLAICLLSSQ